MKHLPANESYRGRKTPHEPFVRLACENLLDALLIDRKSDPNTQGTARRMAKMFCREIFAGRYTPPPTVTTFPNTKKLNELVVTGPITVRSTCSHHFCPISGECYIGIIYDKKLAGLSKFNRVVEWFASRPQIQEELVVQIADHLEEVLAPKGLAVMISATHGCMTCRGVKEGPNARMTTNVMRGALRKPATRAEFMATLALH